MKYGVVFPSEDPWIAGEFALIAEKAGWDGFFVWEPVWGFDAWVMLATAAARTERIRLGTMITPISRMRPWELASKSVALDHLSKGRTIISVGLGSVDNGFEAFGEEPIERQEPNCSTRG
jgi:alkanesulfonate monooxygenase SsuD/methylene tetrahydromethanopterin reductase-like flavin-dependent oxidoreductase (luciferase family)